MVGRMCSVLSWLSLAFFPSLVFEDKPLLAAHRRETLSKVDDCYYFHSVMNSNPSDMFD